jgi:hypothetical protein
MGKLMTGLEYIRKRFGELADLPAIHWALGCAIPSDAAKRAVEADTAALSIGGAKRVPVEPKAGGMPADTAAKPAAVKPAEKPSISPFAVPDVSPADRALANLGPNLSRVARGMKIPKR